MGIPALSVEPSSQHSRSPPAPGNTFYSGVAAPSTADDGTAPGNVLSTDYSNARN